MTALAYRPKLGTELEFIGRLVDLDTRRLKIVQFDAWYADKFPVLIGRNGRPRGAITLPGYGKGVKPLNTGKRFPPEPLTSDEVLLLMAACPNTMAGIRNRALIALLWRTGLRVSEALALRPHHVDFQGRRVKVLNGKGSKTRTVGVDDGGLIAVQPWLLERALLGVAPTAPLFCTIQRPGRGGTMHDAYVRQMLHKLGAEVGIPKRVHPHGFRHSIACDMIREGFSLTDVQAQLGHGDPSVTAIYLRGMGADAAFEKVAERRWPGGTS